MTTQPADEAAGFERRTGWRSSSRRGASPPSWWHPPRCRRRTRDRGSACCFCAFSSRRSRSSGSTSSRSGLRALRFLDRHRDHQFIGAVLLVLTGGHRVAVLRLLLPPTLATTFAMRCRGTIVVGDHRAITFLRRRHGRRLRLAPKRAMLATGAIRLTALVALIGMSALVTTHDAGHARGAAAADARSSRRRTSSSTSRVRRRSRSRAPATSARSCARFSMSREQSLGVERVFFFTGGEALTGYTVAGDGDAARVRRRSDRCATRPASARSARRRMVIVNDAADERGISDEARTKFGMAAALFIPLIHRGDLVGLLVLSAATPTGVDAERAAARRGHRRIVGADARGRSSRSKRSASSASGLAGAHEGARGDESARRGACAGDGRAQHRGGRRALGVAGVPADRGDDAAHRSVDRAARADRDRRRRERAPRGATARRTVPRSGAAGSSASRARPIRSSARSCRSRRGAAGYFCAPLLAGGEPVGALFMEPAADSVVEDTFIARGGRPRRAGDREPARARDGDSGRRRRTG